MFVSTLDNYFFRRGETLEVVNKYDTKCVLKSSRIRCRKSSSVSLENC